MQESVQDYSQKKFEKLAKGREELIDPMIIETLSCMDDFLEFKQRMVEAKIHKLKGQGRNQELIGTIKKPENIDLVLNADVKGLEAAINVKFIGK